MLFLLWVCSARDLDCYTNVTLSVWQINITYDVKNKIKNYFAKHFGLGFFPNWDAYLEYKVR